MKKVNNMLVGTGDWGLGTGEWGMGDAVSFPLSTDGRAATRIPYSVTDDNKVNIERPVLPPERGGKRDAFLWRKSGAAG